VQSRPSSRNEVLRITRQGRLNQSRGHSNGSTALGYKSPGKEQSRSNSRDRLTTTRASRSTPRVGNDSAETRVDRSRTSRNTLTTVGRGSATPATTRNRANNQPATPVRSRTAVVRQDPQTSRPDSDFRLLNSRNEQARPVRSSRSRPSAPRATVNRPTPQATVSRATPRAAVSRPTPRATVSRSKPRAGKPAPAQVNSSRSVTRSTAKPERRAARPQPSRATKPAVNRGRSEATRSSAKPRSSSRQDRKSESRKSDDGNGRGGRGRKGRDG
jgi:hypothetical protein